MCQRRQKSENPIAAYGKQKFSGSLYFPLGKKQQLVIRYINQDVTEQYVVYSEGIGIRSEGYKYIKHTITAGISWNF